MYEPILPGTETVKRYPGMSWGQHLHGVCTYGCRRINGLSCIKISLRHEHPEAARKAGYAVIKTGTAYAYVHKGETP